MSILSSISQWAHEVTRTPGWVRYCRILFWLSVYGIAVTAMVYTQTGQIIPPWPWG